LENPTKHPARNDEIGSRFGISPQMVRGGANRGIRWRTMLCRLPLVLALSALPATTRAEAPTRYDMAATIATVPDSGGDTLGTKFFFQTGNQVVFALTPSGASTPTWKYWGLTAGSHDIAPVSGFTDLEVFGLNSRGQVVGRNFTAGYALQSALFWTVADGSSIPTGFDAGYSGLNAIAASGKTAGYSDSGSYTIQRWDAAQPSATPITIPLPSGATNPQVVGLSRSGEVLLFVNDSGTARAALWNGTGADFVGPPPDSGETFWPTNCAINSSGDVAMVYFTAGGAAKLHYIRASDRAHWLTFTFDGPIDVASSAYNLHISDAGLASFDTSIGANNTVCVVSAAREQQRTFAGYTSFLNASGALVFGSEGDFYYWDAASWSGSPAKVPMSFTSSSGGFDILGYNDDGNVLALVRQQSIRMLSVLAPYSASQNGGGSVILAPARRVVRLRLGDIFRMQIVKVRVEGGGYSGRLRYKYRGKLPAGLRIRPGDGNLAGRARAPGSVFIRVAALYTVNGVRKQTPYVRVRIIVR
jgi:hypothetical protein